MVGHAERDGPVLAALCRTAGHCAAGGGWVGVARMWRFLIALSAHTSEAVLSGSRMSSTTWLSASPIGAALDLLRRFEKTDIISGGFTDKSDGSCRF